MAWRDVEVWRRQRPYVNAEIRKDAPDHLARLGLATSFVFVVGMAEGATVSALKGDLKFPTRYAIYNTIPSFVGGKVPASSVASAMATPPPVRACPRAAAHAANLRALRTAVAGYTVLSVVFQVALAGGRGMEAYQQAVADGLEVPSWSASGFGDGSTGGVVRLCGARGLEPALVAPMAGRGGYRTPILPVVVSGGGFGHRSGGWRSSDPASSFLSEGALSAVAKVSPRPCYYRIGGDRVFCREAWQPVVSALAEAGATSDSREIVLVMEADAVSSDAPQTLMSPPREVKGGEGRLGEDQAVWGLAMLRRALEERRRERGAGRLASVLLAERRLVCAEGSTSTTVSIDARAALLLSVLSWAEQCHGDDDALADEANASPGNSGSSADGEPAGFVAEPIALGEDRDPAGVTTAAAAADKLDTTEGSVAPDEGSGADTAAVAEEEEEEEDTTGVDGDATARADDDEQGPSASTAARVLVVLEGMGRGVRVAAARLGQVRSTMGRSLGAVSAWLVKNGMRRPTTPDAAINRVLVYDTDDDESFRWLAAKMLKVGWAVERRTSERLRNEAGVPVLVHSCSDEKTLTAAAGHVVKGANVCAVVHSWDCGVEARRLLVGARETVLPDEGRAARQPSAEVICTAEVGEDLFQFVRWQLLSGATTEQVQQGLDDLFGAFYETEQEKP
ncbi:unnamed protein product [Ectocarpus sp. 6 AP-2014]